MLALIVLRFDGGPDVCVSDGGPDVTLAASPVGGGWRMLNAAVIDGELDVTLAADPGNGVWRTTVIDGRSDVASAGGGWRMLDDVAVIGSVSDVASGSGASIRGVWNCPVRACREREKGRIGAMCTINARARVT
jgi:hypothetical protein